MGNCKCLEIFGGNFCEELKCKNGGIGNMTGFCECPVVYEGEFCETCKCENEGTCLHGRCQCLDLFEGNLCEIEGKSGCVSHIKSLF